jgi:hypothetical protein
MDNDRLQNTSHLDRIIEEYTNLKKINKDI